LLPRLLRALKVDCLDLDKSEITLAFFRWANLPRNRVAGPKVELAYLRGTDVNVVRSRQIVVFRRPQKAEAVGKRFEHTLGKDQAAFFGLGGENFKDQFLLSKTGCSFDAQLLGDVRQLANRHLL